MMSLAPPPSFAGLYQALVADLGRLRRWIGERVDDAGFWVLEGMLTSINWVDGLPDESWTRVKRGILALLIVVGTTILALAVWYIRTY